VSTTSTVATILDEPAIRAALSEVTDPEIPTISIVDLGIVHRADVGNACKSSENIDFVFGCSDTGVARFAGDGSEFAPAICCRVIDRVQLGSLLAVGLSSDDVDFAAEGHDAYFKSPGRERRFRRPSTLQFCGVGPP